MFQLFPANSLAAGGSISGTVEDVGGSAIRDICVAVFDSVTGLKVDRTLTDANGTYVVTDLAPASYDVLFRDCVAPLDYATEWHENVRDKDLATPVTVTVGNTTTQVNAALDRWGAITGSVEDVGGLRHLSHLREGLRRPRQRRRLGEDRRQRHVHAEDPRALWNGELPGSVLRLRRS